MPISSETSASKLTFDTDPLMDPHDARTVESINKGKKLLNFLRPALNLTFIKHCSVYFDLDFSQIRLRKANSETL